MDLYGYLPHHRFQQAAGRWHTGLEAFEHQLATGGAAFQAGVGAAQVGGVDDAVMLAQGGFQGAGIHQFGNALK